MKDENWTSCGQCKYVAKCKFGKKLRAFEFNNSELGCYDFERYIIRKQLTLKLDILFN
jgi:hypothetical protein